MQRDGACTSLWQQDVPDYQPKNEFRNELFDVIIVGAGITGITLALLLQKQGKKCAVIEAHKLCYGTTGGTTAHINTIFDNPYSQVIKDFGESGAQQLAKAAGNAVALLEQNVKQYNIDCEFRKLPAYVFSQNDEQSKQLDQIIDGTLKAGIEVSYSNDIPIPVPYEKVMVVRGQAQFNPVKYVFALAKEYESLGGIIIQNCRVENFKDDEIKVLQTTQDELSGKSLVFATHIPIGINLLHFRCAPYRSYALAVKLGNNDYPDGLIYDLYDPYHYYRAQEVNGELFMIAGGEDHKTGHNENTQECFRKLEADVRRHFDVKEVSYKWSSQYYEPADGMAYIGNLPGHSENVYVATGFSGNGMPYSHISALVISDLILRGNSEYKSLFNPNRIKPVAGFTNFIKENADVVGQLISGVFSKEKLHELAQLAPGESKVFSVDGSSAAIHKDENGKLHAVDPACTHAKCTVSWNYAEQSWDCPCHGARYSADGEVITGPASKGLKPINIEEKL
ncbi:MAG: FAD-dependent oxidoreductase [Chitinophagaceae bacterium]|nr:FAD-dependent oxidoreductase [Chitinophagaceae bacterium]